MAAKINIGGDPLDPNYRYTRPALASKSEGNVTRLSNLPLLAKSLSVPAAYIVRYFGYELGTKCNETAFTINGEFKRSVLDAVLERFIAAYVLCPGCGLPETDIEISKSKVVRTCAACPYFGALDPEDKLAQYILKNKKKSPGGKKEASTKQAARRGAPCAFDPDLADIPAAPELPDEEIEWFTDTSKEAVLARQAEAMGGAAGQQSEIGV